MHRFSSGNVNVMDIILHSFRRTIEEVRLTNPVFYSDLLKYPKIMKYFENEKIHTRHQFLDFLDRGIDEGYFRKDVNYDLIARLSEALHRYIKVSQLYKTYSLEEIFFNFIFVSLRGFCTNMGIEILDKFLLNSKI